MPQPGFTRVSDWRQVMQLVVGATGSLGGHIVSRLLRDGQPVRALVRDSSDYSQIQATGVEIALGDLKVPESLNRACLGVERIIATATAATRGDEDTVESVDRAGYAHLIAAAKAAGVEQFVFVSAHGFDAASPVPLARAKADTEAALQASGLGYTILRPALFMESWIGMVLGSQLQSGPEIVVMGDPDRPYPFVAAANVTDLVLQVIAHPDAVNKRIPLSAQAVSYRQVVAWIGAVMGQEIKLESVPIGTELPGLPPIVTELWTLAASGALEPIETVEVAVKFGLTLETPQAFVQRTFGHGSRHR